MLEPPQLLDHEKTVVVPAEAGETKIAAVIAAVTMVATSDPRRSETLLMSSP